MRPLSMPAVGVFMVQTQQAAGESALLERLQAAASEALADVAPMLEHDVPRIRSVQFDLELANNGQVVEAHAWIERVARVRRG